MKKIGIYFNREPYADGTFYSIDKNTTKAQLKQFRSYIHQLTDVFEYQGYKLIVLCREDSYVGGGLFSHYWTPDKNREGFFLKQNEPITISTVYDKGHFSKNDGFLQLVNQHEFSKLGRNKYAQNILFKHLQPKTHLILSVDDAANIDHSVQYVIKPLSLNGGKNIKLVAGNELVSVLSGDEPMLAQEFIESKPGYAGVVTGRHDVRLYIINDEAHLMSVRTPEGDGYLSNTSQGGTIQVFDRSVIPADLLRKQDEVSKLLSRYGPKFYSADYMFDGTKWWLIEINDRPGIPSRGQQKGAEVDHFHQAFASLMISVAEKTDE